MAPKNVAAKIAAELRASGADTAAIRAALAKQGFSKGRISQICPLKPEAVPAAVPARQMPAAAEPDADDEKMPALMPADDAPDEAWVCKQCGNVEMTNACRICHAPRHACIDWLFAADSDEVEELSDDGSESLGLVASPAQIVPNTYTHT